MATSRASYYTEGLLADRPASGRPGLQYRAMDEGKTYLDIGTGWIDWLDPLVVSDTLVLVGDRDVEISSLGTKGVIMDSPNGTRYRVTVDDTGALVTTAL